MTFRARLLLLLPLVALVAWPALAGDYTLGTLQIVQPWSRPSTSQAQAGAAFLAIANKGALTDRLLSAASPAAEKVELHTHVMDGNVMRMRAVDAIEIAAGGTVKLEPGGLHVMLFGLKQQLVVGQTFPLTLRFERAGEIVVDVQVERMSGPPGTGAGQHRH